MSTYASACLRPCAQPDFVPLEDAAADDAEEWTDPSEGGVLTKVFEACERGIRDEGDLDTLKSLLGEMKRCAVGIDTRGPDQDTALHNACLYGHVAIVKELLDQDADPTTRDDDEGAAAPRRDTRFERPSVRPDASRVPGHSARLDA